MAGILRHRPARERGRARDEDVYPRCGESSLDGSLPRAWTRALQGGALAFGAPLGWLALRMAAGHDAGAELATAAPLYLYMFLGSAATFIGFGAALGRH